MTVRFETRETGPGRTRNFRLAASGLTRADPLDSLGWDQDGDDAAKNSDTR